MIKKFMPVVILVLFVFVFYEVYISANKSMKIKREECQTKTVTFEKIFVDEPIKESIDLLLSNNYTITSQIEYSKFMKSHLIDILSKEDADKKLKQVLYKYITGNETNDKKLVIDYYIYENDKNDPSKKESKSKLFAGYLLFEFKLDNKLIYKIQTDYMDLEANDITDRMDCVVHSFISIN